MAASGPLVSFGTILSGLAKQLGLETRLVELRIQQQWPALVGEPIGSHTWPAQIRFHKLYLLVENSVWLQQLTFLKPALLAKLNAEAGSEFLTDIVLRVGEIPSREAEPSPAPPAPRNTTTSDEELAEFSSHASAIQDPSIRRRFREVISNYPSQTPLPPEEDPSRVP
jgi:predicted nucleic acid-binding Zn ribbon protein